MRDVRWIGIVLAVAAVVACNARREAEAPEPVDVEAPFARFSSGAGAAYLRVVNTSSEADRLVRVESSIARHTDLHEVVQVGGLARMQERPEGFVVPAGGALELRPGGPHVMLTGLRNAPPEPGSDVELVLHFEKAGPVRARVPVRPLAE